MCEKSIQSRTMLFNVLHSSIYSSMYSSLFSSMLIDVYELGAGVQRRCSSLWEAQGRE